LKQGSSEKQIAIGKEAAGRKLINQLHRRKIWLPVTLYVTLFPSVINYFEPDNCFFAGNKQFRRFGNQKKSIYSSPSVTFFMRQFVLMPFD
jgi:hypothetical protein